MEKRAAFLDRDSIINRDMHYLSSPESFELLPGVPEGIKLLNEHEFKVIVGNQSLDSSLRQQRSTISICINPSSSVTDCLILRRDTLPAVKQFWSCL